MPQGLVTSAVHPPRGGRSAHGRGARVDRGPEVALGLLAVDEGGAHPVAEDRVGYGVAVDVESRGVDVGVRVAGRVVAGVVLLAHRASPDAGLLGGLVSLGTREEATRRDPDRDERTVVG